MGHKMPGRALNSRKAHKTWFYGLLSLTESGGLLSKGASIPILQREILTPDRINDLPRSMHCSFWPLMPDVAAKLPPPPHHPTPLPPPAASTEKK